MNFKYLLVLILFIFNFSATVVADNSHIELPSVNSQSVDHQSHDHNEKHPDQSDNKQHCSDHDCCHQGHVHVYLMTLKLVNVGSEMFSSLGFPAYIQVSNTAFLEIIKPPLV